MAVDVPILKLMDTAGVIYQLATVPSGGYVMAGDEELIYEETSINSCQSVTLESGQYRIELKGGKGGGKDIGGASFEGAVVNYDFTTSETVTVNLFRGGDGTAACNGNGVTGGGASGVDTLFVFGDTVVRANGGNGAAYGCSGYNAGKVIGRNSYTEGLPGGGGFNTTLLGYYNTPIVNGRSGSCRLYIATVASGGGGAPSGKNTMTKGCTYDISTASQCSVDGANCSAGATPGTNATTDRGGNGGDAYVNYQDISLSASGGTGGATVSWSCAGQTAYSYGGGGGPAVCTGGWLINADKHNGFSRDLICIPGQDGNSGSTGNSSTSYIRIFKVN